VILGVMAFGYIGLLAVIVYLHSQNTQLRAQLGNSHQPENVELGAGKLPLAAGRELIRTQALKISETMNDGKTNISLAEFKAQVEKALNSKSGRRDLDETLWDVKLDPADIPAALKYLETLSNRSLRDQL